MTDTLAILEHRDMIPYVSALFRDPDVVVVGDSVPSKGYKNAVLFGLIDIRSEYFEKQVIPKMSKYRTWLRLEVPAGMCSPDGMENPLHEVVAQLSAVDEDLPETFSVYDYTTFFEKLREVESISAKAKRVALDSLRILGQKPVKKKITKRRIRKPLPKEKEINLCVNNAFDAEIRELKYARPSK